MLSKRLSRTGDVLRHSAGLSRPWRDSLGSSPEVERRSTRHDRFHHRLADPAIDPIFTEDICILLLLSQGHFRVV